MDPEEQNALFESSRDFIQSQLSSHSYIQNPKVLIICGSGLSTISTLLTETESIKYTSIPGFAASHVPGHAGELLFGLLSGVPVMCMLGRFHYYEGHSFFTNTLPIRVAHLMGVTHLVVTNAAGGVRNGFKPGDLMVINDHINFPGLAGNHPLRGLNLDNFGDRFLPLSDAYDFDLRVKLFESVKALNIKRNVHEGVYFYAAGPTFESRAECRMIRLLGGDAVGMSTVPEVIVARHCGMKVLGLSLITNSVLSTEPESAKDCSTKKEITDQTKGMASHEEVLQSANDAAQDVKKLVEKFLSLL